MKRTTIEPSATCLATLRRCAQLETDEAHEHIENKDEHGTTIVQFRSGSAAAGDSAANPNSSAAQNTLLGMDRLDACLKKASQCDVLSRLLGIDNPPPWKQDSPIASSCGGHSTSNEVAGVKGKTVTRKKSALGRRKSSMMRRKSSMSSRKLESGDDSQMIGKVDVSRYLSQAEISCHKKIGYAKAAEVALAASTISLPQITDRQNHVVETEGQHGGSAEGNNQRGGGGSGRPSDEASRENENSDDDDPVDLFGLIHKKEVESRIIAQSTRTFAASSWGSSHPAPGYPTPEEVSAIFEVRQLSLLVTKQLFGIISPSRCRSSLVTTQLEATSRLEKLQRVLRVLYHGSFGAYLDSRGNSIPLVEGSGDEGAAARHRKDLTQRKLPPTAAVFTSLLDHICPLYRTLESALQQQLAVGFQTTNSIIKGGGTTTTPPGYQQELSAEENIVGSNPTSDVVVGSSAVRHVGLVKNIDLTVTHLIAIVDQVLTWMRPLTATVV